MREIRETRGVTKLRGHTQIKVEGWSLNVISHRHPFAPSRPKEGGENVQNYELSNNARFPSRTKRNRTKISSFSSFFFSLFLSFFFLLFFISLLERSLPRVGGNIQTALSRPSIRFIDHRKEEREREREKERESRSSRDSTNLIVMMDTSEVKSATTTPRNREGEKGIDKNKEVEELINLERKRNWNFSSYFYQYVFLPKFINSSSIPNSSIAFPPLIRGVVVTDFTSLVSIVTIKIVEFRGRPRFY